MKEGPITRIDAAAVRDAVSVAARPGVVAVQGGRIVYAGPPAGAPRGDRVIDLRDRLVLPQMVNAHCHLELTVIGPRPYTGDFVSWVRMLREHWPGDGDPWAKQPDEQWFAEAAADGARQSVAAGVSHVGDITRSAATAEAARQQGVGGRWYLELFGLGEPWDEPALRAIADGDGLPAEIGWQPHAPYSAGPRVFAAAAASGRPVCTHLAETRDEQQFVASAEGAYRALLVQLGKWSDAHAGSYRRGLSPVQWMRPYLEQARWLVAHCNHVRDDDIAILAETGANVAYCPVASEYFGHGGHRYRDMLAAGVNVCLGTDSIVCQPAQTEEPQPLGILPQMRWLHQRDGTDPGLLLAMATVNGAAALGLPTGTATLQVGAEARLAAVAVDPGDPTDPLTQALRGRGVVAPVGGGGRGGAAALRAE